MKKYLSNKLAICLFIFPALIIFSILVFYPILQTVFRSFYDWDGLGDASFILFDNYTRLFDDSLFITALKNGLIFAAVITTFQIGMGTFLALSVSDSKIGKNFLKTSYFIPVVLSVTVVCQLWMSIYNTDYGLVNKVFELLSISYGQEWLNQEGTAIFAIATVNAWQFMGYHFCLIYAGLKSIPEQYYEAAKIDGAGKWRAHISVTLPMLGETFRFCLVLAITGGLNAFSQMLIMTNGGPGTITYTLTFMTYRSAFRLNEFGYGCASATILVLECLIATVLINKLVARERITY